MQSFVFRASQPLDGVKLEEFLSSMIQVYGKDLLRYKGVLALKDNPHRVVFQGVHMLMGGDLGRPWGADERPRVGHGVHRPQSSQRRFSARVGPMPRQTTVKKPAAPDGKPALLTEEHVLKMPEKEYMNAAQLAFFRDRLEKMKQELLANADLTSEHLRESDVVPDPADRATIEEEHALELRTRDRERKLMKKIDESIMHIDDGSYGYCEETGEPIGIPRLLARPTATLSVEAQQRREQKQKMYGD